MQLDVDWLMQQGEDAYLLHTVSAFYFAKRPKKIAVAVSGGSDSTALLHLLARCAQKTGQPLEAVTLDHGLRQEAAAEAEAVARHCADLGVPHTTLYWDGAQAKGNIMAAARAARYALIADWARDRGITDVALGHTKDDVAENFLMRLSRKAGVDGLAIMASQFERNGIGWYRPLLIQDRAYLRDYLTRNGVVWAEDPTNADPTYDRTRARQVLEALAPLGIEVDTLAQVAMNLSGASSALKLYAALEENERVTSEKGDLLIDLGRRPPLSGEIEDRLILSALRWVGRRPYPPKRMALQHMKHTVRMAGTATLAGCLITMKNRVMRVTREHKAVAKTVARVGQVWDHRWRVDGPGDLEVRALGDAVSECPDWRATGMPRASLRASPAVWDGETLIAAPLAGFNPTFSAFIVSDFHKTPLSH